MTASIAVGLGAVLVYYFATTSLLASYGYRSKEAAVSGALALFGGGCIWLIARVRDALENKLGGTSYIVSISGSEHSFRRRKHADEKIAELLGNGTPASTLKLTKVLTTITDNGSLETRTEDLPIRVS